MRPINFKKNKRGISVMVGYVLLIVFAIIIGSITFQWLRTYIPAQTLECTDGVSLLVKDSEFNSATSVLNVTIKNNGRFNVAGYFIHMSNESGQEIATIDLSKYLNESFGGTKFGGAILFGSGGENFIKPGEEKQLYFDIPSELGEPLSIRIVPTRFQEEDNKNRFVSCGEARVEQSVGVPSTGPGSCIPNCGGPTPHCVSGSCVECRDTSDCTGTDTCTNGVCVPENCIDESISTTCGAAVCGDKFNNCGNPVTCPPGCDAGESCNATGQCVASCGNGVIDTGETCDDGNVIPGDGCSASCTVETGWTCSPNPSSPPASVCTGPGGSVNEDDYCRSLGGYSGGNCVANNGQCVSQGGVNENDEPGASVYCPGQVLCCTPESRIVFITSTPHDGTIGAGGLVGADAICAGDTAGIPGTFVAWLSTDTVDAKDRITDGVYYLFDGTTKVADSKADLLDGTIDHVIDRDSSGNFVSGGDVWTGTNSDGTKAIGSNCNNWQSASGNDKGWTGDSGSTSTWTDKGGENSCSNPQRIYCFRVAS